MTASHTRSRSETGCSRNSGTASTLIQRRACSHGGSEETGGHCGGSPRKTQRAGAGGPGVGARGHPRTFLTRPSRRCGITMPFSALVPVEAERTPRAGQLRDICIHAPFNSAEYQPTGSISNTVPEPQTIRPRCPQRHIHFMPKDKRATVESIPFEFWRRNHGHMHRLTQLS